MDEIYGGLAIISGITIIIGFLFGDAVANGFIQLVVGFFDGIINILSSIINVLL